MGDTTTKRQSKRERELAAAIEVLADLVAETERRRQQYADALEYVTTTADGIEEREVAISWAFTDANGARWDGRRDPNSQWRARTGPGLPAPPN